MTSGLMKKIIDVVTNQDLPEETKTQVINDLITDNVKKKPKLKIPSKRKRRKK